MLYSVVILSFNSQRTLRKCLDSLVETFSSLGVMDESEVFVVENGSSDNSKLILNDFQAAHPALIKPIIFQENTGTTVSRNAALKEAKGQYVLVLDSDAYMTSTVLDRLTKELEQKPKVGLVCPRLTYADGRFQMSTDTFPTLKRKLQRFLSLEKMQSTENPIFERYVDYAISACWLLRKDAVDAVGGFDEKIFYSPEDVDYCMQVWKNGFGIRYVPSVEMIHDAQELSRGFKITKFHVAHLKGLFYLFFKYKYFFSLPNLRAKLNRFD